MIPHTLKRLLGIVLILVGVIGIGLGAFGIYQIWQVKATMETSLLIALTTTQDTIEITQTGLKNVENTLDTMDANITNLNNTILTVAQSLNDTMPVVDSIATLLKDEMPATLEATQTSLETAKASAELLDGVMRAITGIPFYPGEAYNPEIPLHVSVENVAVSLEDLPESLINIGDQLDANQENFSDIEDNLIGLSVSLTDINTDIASAKTTLGDYQTLLTSIETQAERLGENLPGMLTGISWFLSLFIFWLIFTQIGLILQGFTLLGVELFQSPTKISSES